jgi:hypothetical protein
MERSLSIIGSCVSRDGYELIKNRLNLEFYAARTSFASIYGGKSLCVPETDLAVEGKGEFEKRMLSFDVNKETRKLLSRSTADFILVDCIDERFDLLKIKDVYITRSNYLLNTNFGRNLGDVEVIKRHSKDFFELWKQSADKFCHELGNRKVIIHKAFWAKKYLNHDTCEIIDFEKEKLEVANRYNALVQRYYEYLEDGISNSVTIEVEPDLVFSDLAHKWGIDYFHYGPEYYADFSEMLGRS